MQCPHCQLTMPDAAQLHAQTVACPRCGRQFVASGGGNEPFDPYYTWLGIPPSEQPANHYRLLGLQLFEANPNVIENAADRQMKHLQSFKIGAKAALSQRLLTEVSSARVQLLDPSRKAAYDAELRRRTTAPIVAQLPQLPEAGTPFTAVTDAGSPPPIASLSGVRRQTRRSSSMSPLASIFVVLGGVAGLAMGVLIIFYLTGQDFLGLSGKFKQPAPNAEVQKTPHLELQPRKMESPRQSKAELPTTTAKDSADQSAEITPGQEQLNTTTTSPTPRTLKSAAAETSNQRASARFLSTDTTTQGNWMTAYGAEGFQLPGQPASSSPFAKLTVPMPEHTWSKSTNDPRGLQQPQTPNRTAACWWGDKNFQVDVDLQDGKEHQLAVYIVDWDRVSRALQFEILDGATREILSTQTVSAFDQGQYLVWMVRGHILVRVLNVANKPPANAVVSGIFLGGPQRTSVTTQPQVMKEPEIVGLFGQASRFLRLPMLTSSAPETWFSLTSEPIEPLTLALHTEPATLPAGVNLKIRADSSGNTWTIEQPTDSPGGNQSIAVGQIRLNRREFTITWPASPADVEVRRQLANCLLEITCGNEFRNLQLREPLSVPPLAIDFDNEKQSIELNVGDTPATSKLFVTFQELNGFTRGGKIHGDNDTAPFTRPIEVQFSDFKGPEIEFRFVRQPSGKLVIQVKPQFVEAANRKFDLTVPSLEKITRAQEKIRAEAQATITTAKANLATAQSTLQSLRANPPSDVQSQATWNSRVSAATATINQLTGIIAHATEKLGEAQFRLTAVPEIRNFMGAHRAARIKFKIFAKAGGQEVILVDGTGP